MDPKDPTSFSTMPTYGLPEHGEPNKPKQSEDDPNQAADMIRQKINALYEEEPAAKEETAEVIDTSYSQLSKHQQFMYRLSTSGKSLADIQTEWHNYYINLPEKEKHEVWQEFYRLHDKTSSHAKAAGHKPKTEEPVPQGMARARAAKSKTVSQIKKQIVKTVGKRGQLNKRQHLQSLMFGLGMGSIVVLILLFSFFNERIIAPFIAPSRKVSATPIIVDSNSVAIDPQPKIVIPKINVEIPVDYNETSIDEAAVYRSLENGILHYPTTVNPGEKGNGAYFGHSSSNIFNKGKYKFAFLLLNKLEKGDIFYLTKDNKRYVYKVYDIQIVKPTEVGVLGAKDKIATATLITCDPPGTSVNRLVVVGEQISPDPSTNIASNINTGQTQQPKQLPSNAPSLWQRLKNWLSN